MEIRPNLWFIDAWAVHDGRVFASRRLPEDAEDHLQSADTTVFMCVPDLQAVPVGRISTALRAARSGFQARLRDQAGAEIAFESLAQIRDLVRRAYLGSGLGPGSPGAIAGPIPGPDPEDLDGPGARYLQEEDGPALWLGDWLNDDLLGRLAEAVERVAVASLLEWDRALAPEDPDVLRAFVGWHSILVRSGVLTRRNPDMLDLGPDFFHLAHRFDAQHVMRACQIIHRSIPAGWTYRDAYADADWSRGHLAVVRLPRLSNGDRRLRRLIEMRILPLVDRRFWNSPKSALELAPALLIGIVRHRTGLGYLPSRSTPVEAALTELHSSLDWPQLPDSAERALEEFLDSCLAAQPLPAGAPLPGHYPS
jgi:hypothetical protein